MSSSPEALLRETVERRFADGARRAVLVVGAGLQHHLRAHAGAEPGGAWGAFCDWNGLLASVAREFELAEVRHVDPTATWEALVTRVAAQNDERASDAEARALRVLARRLRELPATDGLLARFGHGLRGAAWRDVVSLNFDATLDRALAGPRARPKVPPIARHLRRPTIHTAAERDGRTVRTWYPHGHVSDPDTIQLGQRAYGMGIAALETARERLKSAERLWRRRSGAADSWTRAAHEDWEAARRGPEPFGALHERDDGHPRPLTWLDLFLLSDLVFVGCSLDRGEVDLWWALHQRARNLARIAPDERPRTFVVSTAAFFEDPANEHLRTGVADVIPVGLADWDAGWEVLVGRWW